MKEGKREASGQYTRTRANFKAKHPKGGEKERREQKLLGHNFFLFLFSSFSFSFSGLERVAKHDFYGIVLQSGSVKSSQLDKSRESKESRAREKREREREAGVVCTCARISVRMFLCVCECECVHKARFGKGGRYAAVCVCVCICSKRPSPHPPSKRRLLRTKLFIDSFLFFNVYSYSLVFCVLIFLSF